jgi:hypothetical protein
MTNVGDTNAVVVNNKDQVWRVVSIEKDPNGYCNRVVIHVTEEGKEPWTQVIQEMAYRRRLKV